MAQSPDTYSLTFYYENGHNDTFLMNAAYRFANGQDLTQALHHLFERGWWTFHLSDRTVVIHTAKVIKIEINPPLDRALGEAVFANASQWTLTTRTARHLAAEERPGV